MPSVPACPRGYLGIACRRSSRGRDTRDSQEKLMRRGAKPAKAKVDPGRRQLEKRLSETLAQQTATGEILRVISRSPNDIGPVFDLMTRSAV